MAEEARVEARVCRVAVKLPEFWPDNVGIWFSRVEAQFRISNVTSEQLKFDYVVQKLDNDTVSRIQDVLYETPATNPYQTLKARVTACFAKSDYEKLREFRDIPNLGDQRPSQLMDRLLSTIAGISHEKSTCPFVEFAFLSRLPDRLREMVSQRKHENLRKLAEHTDEVWSKSLHSAVNLLPDGLASPVVEPAVAVVEPAVAAVSNRRAASAAVNQQQPRQQRVLCAWHRVFGQRARRCEDPCDWVPGNGRAGGRRN